MDLYKIREEFKTGKTVFDLKLRVAYYARVSTDKYEQLNSLENQTRPENEIIYDIMLQIGKSRGAVVSGGNVDDVKTANIILEDFRSGKLGRLTLEKTPVK